MSDIKNTDLKAMEDIRKILDEFYPEVRVAILEYCMIKEEGVISNNPHPYIQAIKQLMADEFEKAKIEQTELIRDRFVRDGWEYKWLTEMIEELRQKGEKVKQSILPYDGFETSMEKQ